MASGFARQDREKPVCDWDDSVKHSTELTSRISFMKILVFYLRCDVATSSFPCLLCLTQ